MPDIDERPPSTPVSVVVRQRVTSGASKTVENQFHALLDDQPLERGYLGSVVLRGGTAAQPELYGIVRFRDEESWRAWRGRPDVSSAVEDIARSAGTASTHDRVGGFAGWFDLDAGDTGATVRQPPKWKTAVVTWITIFPLLILSNLALSPLVGGLPWYVGVAAGSLVTIPIMTWLAMPFMTKVFRSWLLAPGKADPVS